MLNSDDFLKETERETAGGDFFAIRLFSLRMHKGKPREAEFFDFYNFLKGIQRKTAGGGYLFVN